MFRRRPMGFVRREFRRMARRRSRRILRGLATILAIGGTAAVIKLTNQDVSKIEKASGKSVENMSESELNASMQKLNIKPMNLSEEDQDIVDQSESEEEQVRYCSHCGQQMDITAKFCEKCGNKIQ